MTGCGERPETVSATAMLRLSLLGPPLVTLDGRPVSFDTRKATALLAVLAVERQPQPRDRLAALLWPDADATRARSALRRTLSVTAAAAGEAVIAQRSVVALDGDKASSDFAEFEALLGAGDAGSLRSATALYRDDFLAGFSLRDAPEFEDWHDRTAQMYRRRLSTALGVLVEHDIDAHNLDRALVEAERWLALDPLHEPAHHALIRIHAWRGDRSAAMRQYRTCVRVLDVELGVEPLAETRELYDAVRRDQLPPPRPTESEATSVVPAREVRAAAIVGRSAELETIGHALGRAAESHGGTVLITGATGSGKTTLLRLAAAQATATAVTVTVRGHPDESTLAFGAAIELLRGLLASAPGAVDKLPRRVRAELARLLPETADLDGPAADADDPAAAARLLAAVRDTVAAVDAPCVFIIDDAQWLDAASSDVLAYLVRRVSSLRLAMMFALSSDGAPASPAVSRAVADAVEDDAAIELQLRPLDRVDVAELTSADPALGGVVIDDVMTDTGGLPALVSAWLDAARSGADPRLASSSVVDETLSRRIRQLSTTTQQVLAAAAVLGGSIDPEVLRETSGRGDAETVTAVEEALHAGLLVEEPSAAGYDLPFEALRRLLVADVTLARLRLLHQRAAAALVRRAGSGRITPADAGSIAMHLRQGGRDEEAAAWHWRAAQEARALHAHEEALTDVRAALALGFTSAPARLAEGEILIALGRYGEAIAALELAAAAAEPHSADAVLIERRLADVHHRLGDYSIAEVHLASALEQADGVVADAEVATMLGERALLALRSGNAEVAQTIAALSLDVARRSGDDAAMSYALNAGGVVAVRAGDSDPAEKLFRDSFDHAIRASAADSAIAASNNLARLLSGQGRHDEALTAAAEALARGEQVGDKHRLAAIHTNLADLLRAMHRDDESMEHLKRAAALFAEVDDEQQRRPEIWKLVEW